MKSTPDDASQPSRGARSTPVPRGVYPGGLGRVLSFPRRILIAAHREIPDVGATLTTLGHTVIRTSKPDETQAAIRKRRPDLILLVPIADTASAPEVSAILSARTDEQATPVLLVTDEPVSVVLEHTHGEVEDVIPHQGSGVDELCDRALLALARLQETRAIEEQLRSVERQSITDFKTGTFNDRYFHRRLREEFSRARRYRSSISCVMFDFDNFKKINDSFDHAFGDFVLLAVAKKVREAIRDSDIPARFGGDEFALLLPNTQLDEAVRIAERIRTIVSQYSFERAEHSTSVTISVGISTFDGVEDLSAEELLRQADLALLEAKRRGRNCVVLSTEVGDTPPEVPRSRRPPDGAMESGAAG